MRSVLARLVDGGAMVAVDWRALETAGGFFNWVGLDWR